MPECNCHPLGSKSQQCDENGKCNCKCNVIGDKCDDCSAEFWNFPTCEGKSIRHFFCGFIAHYIM